jgi:hypothetical protein
MLPCRGRRWHVWTVLELLDRLEEQPCGSPQMMSVVEAVVNVVVGLVVAVATQVVAFPIHGHQAAKRAVGAGLCHGVDRPQLSVPAAIGGAAMTPKDRPTRLDNVDHAADTEGVL